MSLTTRFGHLSSSQLSDGEQGLRTASNRINTTRLILKTLQPCFQRSAPHCVTRRVDCVAAVREEDSRRPDAESQSTGPRFFGICWNPKSLIRQTQNDEQMDGSERKDRKSRTQHTKPPKQRKSTRKSLRPHTACLRTSRPHPHAQLSAAPARLLSRQVITAFRAGCPRSQERLPSPLESWSDSPCAESNRADYREAPATPDALLPPAHRLSAGDKPGPRL